MSNTTVFKAKPQVSQEHYNEEYDDRGRWSSYFIQITEAQNLGGDRILEIGIGNRVVARYLAESGSGAEVTTADIDPALQPDVVCDVAELPFEDGAFDCVIACEVLEHVPFEHARRALGELRRVSHHAIISVPNADRYLFQGWLGIGNKRFRLFGLNWSRVLRRVKDRGIIDQHYWELNREGVSVEVFIRAVEETGWTIIKRFRNPDYPYHHFFIVE